MYCKNCGKELPENAKFCPKCGAEQEAVSKKNKLFQAKIIIGSISSFGIAIIGCIAIFFPSLFNLEVKSIEEFSSSVDSIDDAVKLKNFLEKNQGKTVKLDIKYSPKLLEATTVEGSDLYAMVEAGLNYDSAFSCAKNEKTDYKLKCFGGNGVGYSRVEYLFDDFADALPYIFYKNQIHEYNEENDSPDLGIEIPNQLIAAKSYHTVLTKFPFPNFFEGDRWGEVHGQTIQYFGENSNFTSFGKMSFSYDNTKPSKAYMKNGGLTFLIKKDKKPLSYCISTAENIEEINYFLVAADKKCTLENSLSYIEDAIKSGFSIIIKTDSQDNTLYNWSWDGSTHTLEDYDQDDSSDTAEVVLRGNFFVKKKKPVDEYGVDLGFIAKDVSLAAPSGYSLPSIETYELDPIDDKTLELKKH